VLKRRRGDFSAQAQRLLDFPVSGLFLATALISGTLETWELVGWREINPSNLGWLWGDTAASEVGWEFLRYEPLWRIPLTWVTRLDIPWGASVSYMDVIPLVASALRTWSALLPRDFQYLGLYAVTCFILQAYYGFRLVSCFSRDDRIVSLLGGFFFLISPILAIQLYGHFALSTQWILIACFYYYFRDRRDFSAFKFLFPFIVLAMIAAAITPYIALMAVLISGAALVRAYLERRSERFIDTTNGTSGNTTSALRINAQHGRLWALISLPSSYLLWSAILLGGVLLSLTVFGFIVFGPASQFSGEGYGDYSMNVLAPINPGGPLFLKSFSVPPRQGFEGYNYLGLGVLMLGLITVARRPDLVKWIWSKPLRPLLVLSLLFTLLALSLKVTLGQTVLFTVPAPPFVLKLFATFRSSGRLFWPVHYLLTLAAIVGIISAIPARKTRRLVLASALILQYFDLLPVRAQVAASARKVHPDPLISRAWAELPNRYRHLVILPAIQCNPAATPGGLEMWPRFARMAARSQMTLNSVYVARLSARVRAFDCTETPKDIVESGLSRDTAYVLSDFLAITIMHKYNNPHYCRRVDGFNLCTLDPLRADQSHHLREGLGSRLRTGT
jgi:hypothetical protein